MPLITTNQEFNFEVAFSFLQQDESLAYQIRDLIHDRVGTFIYSEHQKEAVANDGIDFYTQVFSEDARIVVVLYREEWGKTKWTRIEETAIKQRNYNDGPDFTVFISLKWLSDVFMWYDINRFGIKGASTIIEKKIRNMAV